MLRCPVILTRYKIVGHAFRAINIYVTLKRANLWTLVHCEVFTVIAPIYRGYGDNFSFVNQYTEFS